MSAARCSTPMKATPSRRRRAASMIAARVVAADIKDRQRPASAAPADVQALQTAITQNAAYTFLKTRPHTMTTNSGLPL